jgi:hypothetical protein
MVLVCELPVIQSDFPQSLELDEFFESTLIPDSDGFNGLNVAKKGFAHPLFYFDLSFLYSVSHGTPYLISDKILTDARLSEKTFPFYQGHHL